MKKVIFVLALSGLVSFGSYAATAVAGKANTEFTKGGDKKKKKKDCCSSSSSGSKCCEKKDDTKKTQEQPK